MSIDQLTQSLSFILSRWSIETAIPKFCCDFWWVVYPFVKVTQSFSCPARLWCCVINIGPLQHMRKGSRSVSGRKLHFCPVSWSTQHMIHTDDTSYCFSKLFLIQHQCLREQ